MTKNQKKLFIIIVILQIGLLGFMIVKRTLLLSNGNKIIVQCEPVDPRSLFSGDYVILNYKISTIKINLINSTENIKNYKNNDIVFVGLILDENNKYHIAKEFSKDISLLRSRYSVIIRGNIKYRFFSRSKSLSLKYGVEEYFVPQKEGLKIEKNIKNTSAEISVNKDGDSALSRLFINDSEVKFH